MIVAGVWTWVGFSKLKNCQTWIPIQKLWNTSGVGVWKSDSGHLWFKHGKFLEWLLTCSRVESHETGAICPNFPFQSTRNFSNKKNGVNVCVVGLFPVWCGNLPSPWITVNYEHENSTLIAAKLKSKFTIKNLLTIQWIIKSKIRWFTDAVYSKCWCGEETNPEGVNTWCTVKGGAT